MVVLADRRLHDVGNGCTAVHDDPFAVVFSFNAWLAKPGLANGIAHTGCQGLGLTVGGSRRHDDTLEQGGDVLRVKDLNVLRFHVLQAVHDGPLKFLDIFFCGAGGVGHAVTFH